MTDRIIPEDEYCAYCGACNWEAAICSECGMPSSLKTFAPTNYKRSSQMNDDRTFKPEEIVSKLRAENLRLKNVIEIANHRISELEAQNKNLNESLCEAVALKSQQSQESLSWVVAVKGAKKHIAETLRLLQWDQLGWDVPEEVIEELTKAQDALAAPEKG